ncbi:MAG: hypothetical protein AAAFM81_00835 [Pseudomonadota bacterium]
MDDFDHDFESDDIEMEEGISDYVDDGDDDLEYEPYEMTGDDDLEDPEESIDIDDTLYSMMDESTGENGEYPELVGYGIAKLIERRKKKKRAEKRRRELMKRQVKRAKTASKVRKGTLSAINRQLKANSRGIRTNTNSLRRVNKSLISTSRRVSGLSSSVSKAHAVNRVQSKRLAKNTKILKIDGALDLARGVTLTRTDNGIDVDVDFTSLIQGAVKNEWIGKGKGFISSPTGLGALGFLAQNYQAILPAGRNIHLK